MPINCAHRTLKCTQANKQPNLWGAHASINNNLSLVPKYGLAPFLCFPFSYLFLPFFFPLFLSFLILFRLFSLLYVRIKSSSRRKKACRTRRLARGTRRKSASQLDTMAGRRGAARLGARCQRCQPASHIAPVALHCSWRCWTRCSRNAASSPDSAPIARPPAKGASFLPDFACRKDLRFKRAVAQQ